MHIPPLIERGYGIALMRALPRLHVQGLVEGDGGVPAPRLPGG